MKSLTGGWNPLHFVSEVSIWPETMRVALRLFPKSAMKMEQGRLPLHRLCARSHLIPSVASRFNAMIEEYLLNYPEAAQVATLDDHADLPLHCLCRVPGRTSDSLPVLRRPIQLYPPAITTGNAHGWNAIHLASIAENLDIAYELVRAAPEYFLCSSK